MNKIISWLGAGSMAVTLLACGGKVVVDGPGDGNGGAGGQATSTASGSPHSCGDLVVPSFTDLKPCDDTSGSGGTGGPTGCESDLCDANGNVYGAVCTGAACACQLNGFTKCSCTTAGVSDFCPSTPPCCPWIPIPL